jgi:hypothetical protein
VVAGVGVEPTCVTGYEPAETPFLYPAKEKGTGYLHRQAGVMATKLSLPALLVSNLYPDIT